MNLTFPALATVLLLTSGLALADPVKAPTTKYDDPPSAAAAATGAPAVGRAPAPAASSAARTREEVHAEAVEAVRHHRSTFSQDLDFISN